MSYVTVFDASAFPYRNLWFVFPGLILMATGAIMVFKPNLIEAIVRQPLRQRWFFRWAYFLFALIWTIGSTFSVLGDANAAKNSMRTNGCEMVEGRVEHFHPMPWSGHDEESFDVKGVKFWYSDFIISVGFNNTSSHGGPIREGLPVRICYRDGEILRLEIARGTAIR